MTQKLKLALPVFALFVLIILAAAVGGCLGSDNSTKVTYQPAQIESVKVIQDNGTIYAIANVTINGGCQSIDEQNITAPVPGTKPENNEFDIYIPVKVQGDVCTAIISWKEETFELGQVFGLPDGNYTVVVNDKNATFNIKSESNTTKVFTVYEE
ncbi:hypothetical protein MsAg5_15060 [Methanosarcinaceae archaeon Ag5]|uniref:Lipoprotein n=1 Tax=Methanolapillus africanus TaxID=3028297 RepID=A0AAE4MJF1_9EURY|nr:hypothetical protein [Methanosarcinaceae archaeon Ag5]